MSGRAVTPLGRSRAVFRDRNRGIRRARQGYPHGHRQYHLSQGKTFTYSGTYSVPASCSGTMTITTASPATLNLIVWSNGTQFSITGADAAYVYSASGGSTRPAACVNATLSGEYTYDASGFCSQGRRKRPGEANPECCNSTVRQRDQQRTVSSSGAIRN